jgi:hypothetical protein
MADDVKQGREEFQEARKALVDILAAQHPGTTHHDGDGVAIADLPTHFAGIATERANQQREAAAAYLGITVEELDAQKAGASTAPPESTPESRTASLPAGKASTPPKPQSPSQAGDGSGLSGIDLIERAAAEDYAHLFGNAG